MFAVGIGSSAKGAPVNGAPFVFMRRPASRRRLPSAPATGAPSVFRALPRTAAMRALGRDDKVLGGRYKLTP